MDFRRQSSRNVFGTASRSTVHLCSRWQMQYTWTHHAIVSNGNLADHISASHMCDEGLMKLAGNPNWHWNVLQFQLKKWPQGREIQVRLSSLACTIIHIFSPDRSLLTFKTLQHPLFLRWVSPRSFNLIDLYRSLFLWPLDLVLTRWVGKNRLEAKVFRVSRLSLIVTRTKCLQLQWQKTSKVKCAPPHIAS